MAKGLLCAIGDCGNSVYRRGYCNAHYMRLKRHGDPLAGGSKRTGWNPICSVEGCGGERHARGYCITHYQRWRLNGSPLDADLNERHFRKRKWLEAHASYTGDDCLHWPFAVGDQGRGTVTVDYAVVSAPRAMCILAHGEPPTSEHQAAHSCGKGHEGCINPRHLSWKTPVENEADKRLHGTLRKGEDINTARLTGDDVREIRRIGRSISGATLAKRYGVTKTAISSVLTRKTWAWLE